MTPKKRHVWLAFVPFAILVLLATAIALFRD